MKNSLMLGLLALSLLYPSFAWGQTKTPEVTTAQVPELGGRILLNAKKSYFKGEEIILEITLENTGKTPLNFRNWEIEFFYDFEVTAGGKKIEPVPEFKNWTRQGLFSHGFVLGAQAKRIGYVYLGRAFDLSKEDSYTITVSQKSRQALAEGIFTITSQPFDFRVAGQPKFGDWGEYFAPAAPQVDTPPAKQP